MMGSGMKWIMKITSSSMMSMLMVQLISTGIQILSRVILTQGTFIFALITYRHLIAAFCIAPFAFYFERGHGRAKLGLMVIFWVFLSSLTGITMGLGMFYYGLRETTATYATNFLNLIPIVTFIFSLIARMDKLRLNTRRGKVRVTGTILCVGGALIISLYKGKVINFGNHHPQHLTVMIAKKIKPNWTLGTCILAASCFAYAAWFIVQVKLLKAFPLKYWATMLTCVSASIQSAVIGLCIDPRKSSWRLAWNLQLITILYSGVLASAVTFYLISRVVASKGPTYPAMFNPLSLVFIALIEAFLLGEDLSIGSLLGMVVIIVGLYAFLWGNGSAKNENSPLPNSASNGGGGGGRGEAQRVGDAELGRLQLMATVVPTASPTANIGADEK